MYFCTRLRLMQYLVDKGYKIAGTMPNKYRDDMIVWMFIKTPELMQDVDNYFKNINKKGEIKNET